MKQEKIVPVVITVTPATYKALEAGARIKGSIGFDQGLQQHDFRQYHKRPALTGTRVVKQKNTKLSMSAVKYALSISVDHTEMSQTEAKERMLEQLSEAYALIDNTL